MLVVYGSTSTPGGSGATIADMLSVMLYVSGFCLAVEKERLQDRCNKSD
jgi:hypothetical protein